MIMLSTIRRSLALAAALAVLVASGRRRPRPLALWLIPLVLYAGLAVFLSIPGYRVPIDPFAFAVMAAGGVLGWDRLRRARPAADP